MADQRDSGFNGNEGKFVKRAEAAKCTSKYRDNKDLFGLLKDKKAAYVGGRKVLRLLSQEDAVGIRAYIGLDDKENPQLFIVGVNSKGNDILVGASDIDGGAQGLILDDILWCPPKCSDNNELNS